VLGGCTANSNLCRKQGRLFCSFSLATSGAMGAGGAPFVFRARTQLMRTNDFLVRFGVTAMDTLTEPVTEFLSTKPGIQLIRYGTPAMVDLERTYMCPGLVSSIIDIPITEQRNALTVGRFEMRPSVDFPFFYEYLEVKTIVTGKIVVMDEDGVRYEAHAGDVFVFTPPHLVTFLAECDGTAVYVGHRLKELSFLPGFMGTVVTPGVNG
jgi:hypothetical protein